MLETNQRLFKMRRGTLFKSRWMISDWWAQLPCLRRKPSPMHLEPLAQLARSSEQALQQLLQDIVAVRVSGPDSRMP